MTATTTEEAGGCRCTVCLHDALLYQRAIDARRLYGHTFFYRHPHVARVVNVIVATILGVSIATILFGGIYLALGCPPLD